VRSSAGGSGFAGSRAEPKRGEVREKVLAAGVCLPDLLAR
jgi:hypothetical protein